MADTNRGTFIGGVVLGTAIGFMTGLLVAPRKGRDTRKLLKKTATAVPQMAEDISSSVKLQADRLSTAASDNWQDTLDRLSMAIEAGIIASQSVRQIDSPPAPDLKSRTKFDEANRIRK
jgi:gas vesicle protein